VIRERNDPGTIKDLAEKRQCTIMQGQAGVDTHSTSVHENRRSALSTRNDPISFTMLVLPISTLPYSVLMLREASNRD
jgi:hypothetical protein